METIVNQTIKESATKRQKTKQIYNKTRNNPEVFSRINKDKPNRY
jgi:hypothetical protein